MPFILRAKLKRKTNPNNSHPMNHRRGEFGSVHVADALPTGPLPDQKTFATLFVTDVPDVYREGFLDDVVGEETFAVGEIVTGDSGWTGEVVRIGQNRITLKNIVGDPPSRPGENITGSISGSGSYNHFQFDLETIRNWLHAPHQHSTRGRITIVEADSPATLGETLTGTTSGATATIDAQSGSAQNRMDISTLTGDPIVNGSTITGQTSGETAIVRVIDADTLVVEGASGPFTATETINGTHTRNYTDSFGDPQTDVTNWTATVVSEYVRYVGALNVSNLVGTFQEDEPATTPTVNATIGQVFESDSLGRSRRFIPVSSIPQANLDELKHISEGGQNWTDATFTQVKNLVKLRQDGVDLVNKNNATLDGEAQTDVGAPA
jgi:hypothetical protein